MEGATTAGTGPRRCAWAVVGPCFRLERPKTGGWLGKVEKAKNAKKGGNGGKGAKKPKKKNHPYPSFRPPLLLTPKGLFRVRNPKNRGYV